MVKHTVAHYYSAITRKKLLIYTTWTNPKGMMLREKKPSPNVLCYDSIYITFPK